MTSAQLGEQIVGAYHSLITGCEVVSYTVRSEVRGDQMDLDVLGIDTEQGQRTVYICEVGTHLDGLDYGGEPSDDYWSEFGSTKYQGTLDTVYRKFRSDLEYATRIFDDAEEYKLEFWSPRVPEGLLTSGFEKMADRFRDEHDVDLEFLINDAYTEKVEELRDRAGSETKQYGEPAYRFLQIMEHMK